MNRYLPAEWGTQRAVILSWPAEHGPWQPWLTEVQATLSTIAREISLRQNVIIVHQPTSTRASIAKQLSAKHAELNNVYYYTAEFNDAWMRDSAPISIIEDEQLALLDFTFNGWGNKYPAQLDNRLTHNLHEQGAFANTPLHSIDFVLEGGSIESDGQGSLLSTMDCLLNPNRNPDLTQQQIQATLTEHLGIQHFLWLHDIHLLGDDTDSHIDTIARFCDAQTICYLHCADRDDPRYAGLAPLAQQLTQLHNRQGQAYKLVPLPMPRIMRNRDGDILPATYANFLIINNAVLVPTYADAQDKLALNTLRQCFPGRDIIGIDCCSLIQQFGSLHCATMQLLGDNHD